MISQWLYLSTMALFSRLFSFISSGSPSFCVRKPITALCHVNREVGMATRLNQELKQSPTCKQRLPSEAQLDPSTGWWVTLEWQQGCRQWHIALLHHCSPIFTSWPSLSWLRISGSSTEVFADLTHSGFFFYTGGRRILKPLPWCLRIGGLLAVLFAADTYCKLPVMTSRHRVKGRIRGSQLLSFL